LKGIEVMIDVQRMAKDLKKIAEETNTIIIEMEGTILIASIEWSIPPTLYKYWKTFNTWYKVTWTNKHYKSKECWPMN